MVLVYFPYSLVNAHVIFQRQLGLEDLSTLLTHAPGLRVVLLLGQDGLVLFRVLFPLVDIRLALLFLKFGLEAGGVVEEELVWAG